jgi:hypothetical protein
VFFFLEIIHDKNRKKNSMLCPFKFITVLTRMDFDTLVRIRNILAEFEALSGLACNVEKTTLMQFGSDELVPQNILVLGFDVKNEVKLLGLKIIKQL